jgi:hypothetical protein
MVDIYVTDIPFSQLKVGDLVEGVCGENGEIVRLRPASEDPLYSEWADFISDDLEMVYILWGAHLDPEVYPHAILKKVKYLAGAGTMFITNLLDRAARVLDNPNLESDNEKRELVESLRNISSSIAATDVPQFVRDIKYGYSDTKPSSVHITDVPFSALKVDSVVIGINGVKGRITSTFHDVHVSPDSDPKYVFIRWDDQQKDIRYTYERLMYIKLEGESERSIDDIKEDLKDVFNYATNDCPYEVNFELIEEFEKAVRKDEQERIHPST